MNKNKQGFTLVELIVVILILSILGTIGIVSFFRENADARDAVRRSDISGLSKQINLNISTGKIGALSTIIESEKIENKISSGSIMNGASLTGSNYNVGDIDSFVLGGGQSYIDPKLKEPYLVATIQGEFGQFFQVAGTLENQTALVQGNYYKSHTNDLEGLIKSASGTSIVVDGSSHLPY